MFVYWLAPGLLSFCRSGLQAEQVEHLWFKRNKWKYSFTKVSVSQCESPKRAGRGGNSYV